MKTYCVRDGQIESGVVEHEGRAFTALGSSIVGTHVTGYTRSNGQCISLSTWCGKTMLNCRSEIIERFWDGSLALMFRLPQGRFIAGYALGDHGMLFRGELITGQADDDARQHALYMSETLAEIDAEDDEAYQAEPEL